MAVGALAAGWAVTDRLDFDAVGNWVLVSFFVLGWSVRQSRYCLDLSTAIDAFDNCFFLHLLAFASDVNSFLFSVAIVW